MAARNVEKPHLPVHRQNCANFSQDFDNPNEIFGKKQGERSQFS
jgi:hypothetical protein